MDMKSISQKLQDDIRTIMNGTIIEAAAAGTVRTGTSSAMTTRVLHNDKEGNYLHMTHHNEESGAVAFHGKVHGHKIKFESEGDDGMDPEKSDITRDLKDAHKDLPAETHSLVKKIAHGGVKHLMGEANIKHPNQQALNVHEPEKDEITAHDFKKLRAMKKKPDGKVHDCATHVEHTELGRGVTISEQHAEPDENGDIEWYAVQFESGVYKVYTEDLTITMSEAHMHESEEEQIQELAGKAAQQAAIAISLIKAGKKDGKMPKPMKEDSEQVEEEEKKKVVSPFDYKNYKSQIPTKPGETAGFDSKKISTGTVYSRKPVKEESHQSKTTMKHIPNASPALKKAAKDIKPGIAGIQDRFKMLDAGGVKREEVEVDEAYQTAKSEFVARQGRLTAAAAETEKDPARLKRMSSIPGYSAAMDLAKKTTQGAKHTKEEFEQLDEIGDTPAGMEKVKSYRAAVGRQTHKTGEYDTRNTDRKLNPFHAKDKAQFPANKTANRIAGAARAKKIETGTRYEEAREYTFAEYLDAARAQYVDEDAVLVANEAFKNKDITLFNYQSQSPEA